MRIMGLKHILMKGFVMRFGVPRVKKMIDKQRSLTEMQGGIAPSPEAPTRFEIPLEAMNILRTRDDIEIRHIFPMRRLLSIIKNIHLSVDSIPKDAADDEAEAPPEFLEQLREYAEEQGVNKIGFTRLPSNLIFDQFGVLYDNAIVLAMEMPKDLIDKAPSQATLSMVFGTYDDLGKAANRIAEFIRNQGYAAHADHPLGGLVLFPPLAQKAGIGHIGAHGLLITREFGPRVRLAAVYTNIRNLPLVDSPGQEWIDDYCSSCKRCIRQCPANAILEEKIVQEGGRITSIKQQDCFEYFIQYYGCSVCVKVCPFSKGTDTYDRLRAKLESG